MSDTKTLYRSEINNTVGGVASGLGEYFDVDSSLIRILFIFLTLVGGSGIFLYLIFWLVLPVKSKIKQGAMTKETLEENAREIEKKAKETVEKFTDEKISKQPEKQVETRRQWLGLSLLIIGVMLLLQNSGLFSFRIMWPAVLILIGLTVIFKK